jgi:hypothetical protein
MSNGPKIQKRNEETYKFELKEPTHENYDPKFGGYAPYGKTDLLSPNKAHGVECKDPEKYRTMDPEKLKISMILQMLLTAAGDQFVIRFASGKCGEVEGTIMVDDLDLNWNTLAADPACKGSKRSNWNGDEFKAAYDRYADKIIACLRSWPTEGEVLEANDVIAEVNRFSDKKWQELVRLPQFIHKSWARVPTLQRKSMKQFHTTPKICEEVQNLFASKFPEITKIWDCACGTGELTNSWEIRYCSDVDRTVMRTGENFGINDFVKSDWYPKDTITIGSRSCAIVVNPPFGKKFIDRLIWWAEKLKIRVGFFCELSNLPIRPLPIVAGFTTHAACDWPQFTSGGRDYLIPFVVYDPRAKPRSKITLPSISMVEENTIEFEPPADAIERRIRFGSSAMNWKFADDRHHYGAWNMTKKAAELEGRFMTERMYRKIEPLPVKFPIETYEEFMAKERS